VIKKKAVSVAPQNSSQLKELAFTVLRDLYRLGDGLTHVDPDKLAERIHRIHAGLNPEKEFHAIVSWLAQATTVHAIEDSGNDNAERTLRAPDYLLVSNVDGRDLPVLIEVKATDDDKLVWSDRYLSSLQRFADLLRLPLLVAWKRHEFWTLVDTAHFELCNTAYHLTFERAMKENLMFLLCGEVFVTLQPHSNSSSPVRSQKLFHQRKSLFLKALTQSRSPISASSQSAVA